MIRLLYRKPDGAFAFAEDPNAIHEYGVLSHTWNIDAKKEVTYGDILNNTGQEKLGYKKLQLCARLAFNWNLEYFWCDTCCINRNNDAELNEAIPSMFEWYTNATVCWAYLEGVYGLKDVGENPKWEKQFLECKWFKRGWTLQEFLAPPVVEFFSQDEKELGTRESLVEAICKRTKIPKKVVLDPSTQQEYSVATRMKWAKGRKTMKEEDEAYCLQGLFGVRIPPRYGEKRGPALARLKKAVDKVSKPTWRNSLSKVVEKILWNLTALAALFGILPSVMQSTYVQYLPGLNVSLPAQSLAYSDLNASWPVFAILGKTGVGKSSFIEVLGGRTLATGSSPEVCDGLESCTDGFSLYAAQLNFGGVYLIDTPGFDDSKGRSDESILNSIWDELGKIYQGEKRLKGIIYLYDISAIRIGGMSAKAMEHMQRLCGASEMRHLTLVTTRWAPTSDGEEQEKQVGREKSLIQGYWGDAIKRGAFTERYDGTKAQASAILGVLTSRKELFLPNYKDGPSDFREQERPIVLGPRDKKLAPTDKQPVPADKISTPIDKISAPVGKIPAAYETRPAPEDDAEGLCISIDATSFWTVSSHEFWSHWISIGSLRSATSICADPKAMALALALKSLLVLASQVSIPFAAEALSGISGHSVWPRILTVVGCIGSNWLFWEQSTVTLDTLADAGCATCTATAWHVYRLPALLYRAFPFVSFLPLPDSLNGHHPMKQLVMVATMVVCLYLQYTYVW